MTIRANADSRFLLKYLVIGLACVALGLYGAHDAFIKGPNDKPIVEAWENLKNDDRLDDAERDKKYKILAEENGWPSKRPSKTVAEAKNFIIWNYGYMVIGLGIGIPCLFWYLRNRGTWVEADDKNIKFSGGVQFAIDQITQFDKKRWEKKGIGVLSYRSNNRTKTFVLDDLKYSRQEMDAIVRNVESKIPRSMIVNGLPESESTETASPESSSPKSNSPE